MTGKAPRSARTKAAILDAARALFAETGFDQTTVRAIAARAGVDPALVMRYFGTKDALFARAVDIDLRLPDFAGVPRDGLGSAMIRHFLSLWEDPATGPALQSLLKTAATDPDMADRIRGVFRDQVVPAISAVVPDAHRAETSALVSSQLLGLALCRYVLALPPLAGMDPDRIAAAMGPVLQGLIDRVCS